MGYILENPHPEIGIIKELKLPLKEIYKNKNAQLFILFYKYEGNNIDLEPIPYSEIIINVDELSKKNNTVNILDKAIGIPPQGIFISLKVIEETGISFHKISVPSFSLMLTKEKEVYYVKGFLGSKWVKAIDEMNGFGISYTAFY